MNQKHNPNITYTEEKIFTAEQVQELFLALNWVSGTFPTRLHKALMHSSTVMPDGVALTIYNPNTPRV